MRLPRRNIDCLGTRRFTSSGRGRKPHWFVKALPAGKTADELAVAC
ncbi:MAG: H-NS family nucleoid-associated regulatory protein [Pararhodobacter sp.]